MAIYFSNWHDTLQSSLIVGFGMTGKATAYSLKINNYTSERPEKIEDNWQFRGIKYFILCLPTPTREDGKQDLSAIRGWLNLIKTLNFDYQEKPVIVIRSTVLPGTTKKLSEEYPNLEFAHIPEFLTESSAIEDAKNPEFVVIGSENIIIRERLKDLFYTLSLPKDKFILCSSVTAELIKYSMNSFFALKVIFGNTLWDIAKESGANYELIKKVLETHKWGSKNGWNAWQGCKRGFTGKCLPKDVLALFKKYKSPLLGTMIEVNKKLLTSSA